MESNAQVIAAWAEGREAEAANLKSTGTRLFSYRLQIGETLDGIKIAGDFTAKGGAFYSQTTSHHVSRAKSVAHLVVTPRRLNTLIMVKPSLPNVRF